MIDRYISGAVFAVLLIGALSPPASASDYIHQCRTADGYYVIDDGDLRRSEDGGRSNIRYSVLSEKTLERHQGYCISNEPSSGGQKYGFESKSYVMHIRFRDRGQSIKTFAICEMISDGLPAAYNCDKRVDGARKASIDPSSPSGTSRTWNHNGSIMRLEADGTKRRFVYEKPRQALASRGVTPGIVLFEGERDGDEYRGASKIFSRSCGQLPYTVSGHVSNGDTRVTLRGRAPRVNADCDIVGYRNDKLVFDLVKD
ncbi:MAG: hypothetical protein ACR2O4_17145 [Hyphomicrobiaceae bacterium]